MVEMPFSLHFILSFVVIAPSRLRFSCSTASAVAPRLEIAGSAMLVQHERRLHGDAGPM